MAKSLGRVFVIATVLAGAMTATSAQAQPTSACGMVVRYPTCLVFELDSGGAWTINSSSGLSPGQRGRLSGLLDPNCLSACPGASACILNPVLGACGPPVCAGDFDRSGAIGLQDLFTYLEAFFGGTVGPSPPSGDFDQSGAVSVQDLFQFLAAWFHGCP